MAKKKNNTDMKKDFIIGGIALLVIALGIASLIIFSGPSNYQVSACYQESANEANDCGGLDGGNYSVIFDNSGDDSGIYVTYQKPKDFVDATWVVKHGGLEPYNVSIPNKCLNAYEDIIRFRLIGVYGNFQRHNLYEDYNGEFGRISFGQCFDGEKWNTITEIAYGEGSDQESICDTQGWLLEKSDRDDLYYLSYDGDWGTFSTRSWVEGWHSCGPKQGNFYEEAVIWKVQNKSLPIEG